MTEREIGHNAPSTLVPTAQAAELRQALIDYLRTTFALADAEAQESLVEFLEDPSNGIFRGPYIRLRLPFRPAETGWDRLLDWLPEDFIPYGHQAAAYARLASRDELGRPRRPLPTLVTTGTGSGKTESFIHPILDHVLRARREGVTGTKALILYPMNALANDQAGRLAHLITSDPRLAGVTAGVYTGEEGPRRTVVSAEGLINERAVLRSSPPDILLTNYKMLDQLLLRAEDQVLWQQSADSVTYLVLDEFHTYDGAQGTDVAMLLRRLGLALQAYRTEPDDLAAGPLGHVTPVATSATLGDGGDPSAMINFATTVFGEQFDTDCVVTESRLGLEEWLEGVGLDTLASLATRPSGEGDGLDTLATRPSGEGAGLDTLASLTTRPALFDGRARSLADLAADVYGEDSAENRDKIRALVGELSRRRAELGRGWPSVETHLWIRELTRIDRAVSGVPEFRWSEDGRPIADETTDDIREAYPAIYCRYCGRSGWGVELAPTGTDLGTDDPFKIRSHHAMKEGRFRALIHAPAEAAAEEDVDGLAWLDLPQRVIRTDRPPADDAALLDGRVLPVLVLTGNADVESHEDQCPACDRRDGIRFLGSAIATMLSVTLASLFGSPQVEAGEKKALIFTDSVQDAAHRAGFVESRSHTLSLRSAILTGLSDDPTSLDLVADRVITAAGSDPFLRYRLLAPDLIGREEFDKYWKEPDKLTNRVLQRIRDRVLFDVVCEFGVHSRVGRTLEATGTAAAEVDLGPRARLVNTARAVVDRDEERLDSTFTVPGEAQLVAWVRGVVEHLRTQGAIHHKWLDKYLDEDGNRFRIWGGRPRSEGMPAFPLGRTAPAFPRIGPKISRTHDPLLDAVTSPQSWFARWTGQVLGVEPGHGAKLARSLLERLRDDGLLVARPTESGGTVFALPQQAVTARLVSTDDLARGEHLLRCSLCRTEQAGGRDTVAQLDGAPCLLVRCTGTLQRVAQPDNYYRRLYRSTDMRRVVAREHTGLINDELRLTYESGFKAALTDPGAPNVLVATPTLEMGIDIGDLSTVMLASLPRSVASYLQRVGRAGRRTGSALDVAFVTGRGESLHRLGNPLSVIDGEVRPPATYLSAEEILRRQYLAHLIDRMARDPQEQTRQPRRATTAMDDKPGSFLARLIERAETEAQQRLDEFLSTFQGLEGGVADRLRTWATATGGAGTSELALQVRTAAVEWSRAVETFTHRRTAMEQALPEFQTRANSPAATEEDKRALRAAEASLRQIKGALAALRGEYWIGVLEEYGLLPNYTLLGDAVTLDVAVSWLDPETQTYDSAPLNHRRASGTALQEFAPGATFYAQGLEIEIDAVDLGSDGDAIKEWALCAECGHARDLSNPQAPKGPCPRCGDATITDTRQRFRVVELSRVSAQARRDDSRITDRSDERRRARFTVVPAVDIDPAGVASQWFVDGQEFGATFLRRVTVRWFNIGPRTGIGAQRTIAGETGPANLFRVCPGCGVLDRTTKQNRPDEHRAWCRYRRSTTEHVETIALSRTLTTQGVVLTLPWSVTLGGETSLPSLTAAIMLGLRERFGGSPDHLGVTTTVDPVIGGDNRRALLLHDTVPGGTGYLAELATPEKVWQLLRTAWDVVTHCPCRDEGRDGCHRCLVPYAPRNQPDHVSRSTAERHLREILGVGPAPDEPPETMSWTWTDATPPPTEVLESHLELKFRQRFAELATGLSGSVTEVPGPNGAALKIQLPKSPDWLLEPQVLTAYGSKPDFVLTCADTSVPPVAIFTDGYAYHASPAHNRLADDAAKRRDLADAGYLVLGITSADLGTDPPVPAWWHEKARSAMIQHQPAAVATIATIAGGPLQLLRGWLQQPDRHAITALANAVPLRFFVGAKPVGTPARVSTAALARELLDTAELPDGTVPAVTWRNGPLAVVARAAGAALDFAVMLDDRQDAVAEHGFRDHWQDWLRLSNALQLATAPVTITTVSQGADAAVPEPPAMATGWDIVWPSGTEASVRDLADQLAAAAVPQPDHGEEIGDTGIPADWSWPEQRVAVLFETEEGDAALLAEEGWTLVEPDLDAILGALTGKD